MTEYFSDRTVSICVLKGSPNKDSITGRMLDKVLERYPGASVKFFDAYSMNASACTDCKFCSGTFGCSSDDLDSFFEAYESCDVFIAAFPIYFLSLPAPMKSVLDRFQKYFSARFSLNIKRPVEKERIGLLVSSCGSGDETVFSIASKQWKMAFSVSGIKRIETVFLSGTDTKGDNESVYLPQIEKAVYQINNFLKGDK